MRIRGNWPANRFYEDWTANKGVHHWLVDDILSLWEGRWEK